MNKSFKPFVPRVIKVEIRRKGWANHIPPNVFVPSEEDWEKVMEALGVEIPPRDVFMKFVAPRYIKSV